MSNALADTEPVEGMLSTQAPIVFFLCLPAIAVIAYAYYICSFFDSATSRWEEAHRAMLPASSRAHRDLAQGGPLTRSKTRAFLTRVVDDNESSSESDEAKE